MANVPKSSTKIYYRKGKCEVKLENNVERAKYSLNGLTYAALRDVGKFVCKKFRENYDAEFQKRSGKGRLAVQYWARKKDLDLHKIAAMVKTRIEVFPDICDLIDFFETLPEYDPEMYTHKKMKTNPENSLELLKEVVPVLEAQDDFSNDALFETLKAFATEKEYKVGYVMWPIRTAISGKQNTPGGATELMEVLGKEESLSRLKAGIEKLS